MDKIQQEYKQKQLIEEEINSLLPRVHRFLDDLVQMKHICEYHDNLLYNANNNLTDKIMELREKSKNKKIDEINKDYHYNEICLLKGKIIRT